MNKSNKKKTIQNKLNINRQNLESGIALHKSNPLFSRLGGYLRIQSKAYMGKETAGFVRSNGDIFLNQDYPLSPSQWAYAIAHCQLHLAFGHFDAEKMPGFLKENPDGTAEWKVSCNPYLWNQACDIYIAKFLYDVKFGTSLNAAPAISFPGSLTDERKIYSYLLEQNCSENYLQYGTASSHSMDMQGLDNPLVYEDQKNKHNEYALKFAYALAHSVSSAVSAAGGHDLAAGRAHTASWKAAQWFINHYPLLGGLASAFQIIEDYNFCIKNEISIAAVDVTCAEIYVNPAAGLSFEELKFVLAHEFLHAGLLHQERCQGRDPYLWNVACDYVINGWLSEMEIGHMPKRGLLYNESLKNISAENLYDRIVRDLRKYAKSDTFRGYGKGDIIDSAKNTPGFRSHDTASLDDFYKSAMQSGLEYHSNTSRGYIPAGLIEEIRALAMPPIPWDVELGRWFDCHFAPLEKRRSYARPSRRQGSTPDIPRPSYVQANIPENSLTFGVVIDTSGSMSTKLIGYALGAIASYAAAKDVPFARVVFCDARAYDAGYLAPEDIAGRVRVQGRGGTILQPGINLLENAQDFPKDGPILVITDSEIEDHLTIHHNHAYLIPRGRRLPFTPRGKVFYFSNIL